MKLKIKEGTTSKIAKVFIQDSSATDGSGLTGLVYNSSGLTAYWIAEGDATATSITLATATVGTYTSGGFIAVDGTNMPGVYEFGIPDAAIDSSSEGSVVIMLKGATNMAPVLLEVELDAIDYQDSVRAGLTALPNAAADAAGGLVISDAGGLDIDAMNTNINDIETDTNALQTDWADGGRLDLIVDAILDDTGTSGVLLAATATSAQLVDDVWDEPLSGHNTGGTAGKALRGAGGIILHSGTSDNSPANTSTTISLETGAASTTDDIYTHQTIIITGGTGAGQARIIADYDGATNQSATITPAWGITPDATSEYEIIPGVVHAETQGGGYAGGAVWIGPSGSTGTQLYVDGTVDNPIDDGQMANARTVADALNLRVFRVEPTSSITLDQTYNGYVFQGIEYSLNLGTQDASNSYIDGANVQASTVTGSGIIFDNCIFDNAVTLPPCVVRNSYFGDTTLTAGSAGNFYFNRCVSRAAGSASPNFDFGAALNASNLNMRAYSGGIEIENMGAGTGTYNASIEGFGALTLNANCSATSNISLRGAFKVTDNAGGAVTVTRDDTYTNTSDILTDTADMQPKLGTVTDLGGGATLSDNLSDMAGATFSTTTDSQEAIRDRGDAAWTTGSGTGLTALASGTAQSGTASTIQLAAGETFGDDILNGAVVNITGGTGAGQTRVIYDYTGATDTATVTPNWTTNPDNTSTYEVVAGSVNITAVSNAAEDIATATALATVDTNVDDILVDTGTSGVVLASGAITATVVAADAIDADALATDAVNEIVDQVWDEATSAHNSAGSFGKALRQVKEGVVSVESTVNDASATTTSFITALTETTDDFYNDKILVFINNGLAGQSRVITDYNGTTKTVTFDEALTSAPANGDGFIILAVHQHSTTQIATAVTSDMDANSTQLAAIVADTDELQGDWANGGRLDIILDATATQASLDALNDISVADVLTTAMTESYGTDGSAVTLAQGVYVIMQGINEFAISGTTKTVKQLDGTTTAYTSTLDDATSPTSITRAT